MSKSKAIYYYDIVYCSNPIDGVLAVRLFADGSQTLVRL